MINKSIIYLLFAFFILFTTSCKQTEEVLDDVEIIVPEFKIINAYSQKMIPGQQNQKPFVEFGFEVIGIEKGTVIDSVYCEIGKRVNIKSDGIKKLKIQLLDNLKIDFKFENALFFFTKDGNSSIYELNQILKKEETYLP